MTLAITALLLLSQAPALDLNQIRADASLEHRAKLAIEFAASAERTAEEAYGRGEMKAAAAALKSMLEAIELASQSLRQTGKSARKHPAPFKSAELRSQDILRRLNDLERRMDGEEREMVLGPRARLQEIHDEWFEEIMSRK